MQNLLLGAPGGGKTFEAVVYHVLPALKRGRKVVTNLPLNLEAFRAIDASYPDLIELRTGQSLGVVRVEEEYRQLAEQAMKNPKFFGLFKKRPPRLFPFSQVEDYQDTWKHPEEGFGCLYIIDEAHKCIPRTGTPDEVAEWFAEHRHANCDILLITQSYGKVCKDIVDQTQIVYRVRKNVALGSTKSYVRKVQDGIRGAITNETIRKYKPEFFPLYRSHTKGLAAEELNADDIIPIWKHWSFKGAALCLLVFLGLVFSGNFKMPGAVNAVKQSPRKPVAALSPASSAVPALPPASQLAQVVADSLPVQPQPAKDPEPFAGKGLHLTGFLQMASRVVYTFGISQNGQLVSTATDEDLRKAGYTVRFSGPCIGVVEWEGTARAVTCDLPSVALAVPTGQQQAPQISRQQPSATPDMSRAAGAAIKALPTSLSVREDDPPVPADVQRMGEMLKYARSL